MASTQENPDERHENTASGAEQPPIEPTVDQREQEDFFPEIHGDDRFSVEDFLALGEPVAVEPHEAAEIEDSDELGTFYRDLTLANQAERARQHQDDAAGEALNEAPVLHGGDQTDSTPLETKTAADDLSCIVATDETPPALEQRSDVEEALESFAKRCAEDSEPAPSNDSVDGVPGSVDGGAVSAIRPGARFNPALLALVSFSLAAIIAVIAWVIFL